MNRLAVKTAIVSGGAVGIGPACVQHMAEEGAKVTIFDVLEAEGMALASELTTSGHVVAFWPVDVSDEAAMKAAIEANAARFGGLQVMVNNADISGSPKPTDQAAEVEWDRVQAVNVKGVFSGTKHAIPHLRTAGKESIIDLSSIAAPIDVGRIATYHASKGAVRMMTKNDAINYAPEKIRVNSIHSAYTWTQIRENHMRATAPDLEVAKAAAGAVHPICTMGEPDDIAWALVWLASDEAKSVTGAEIFIGGGYTALNRC